MLSNGVSLSLPYVDEKRQDRRIVTSFEGEERFFLIVDEAFTSKDKPYVYAGSLDQRNVKELFFSKKEKRSLKTCRSLLSKVHSLGKQFFVISYSEDKKKLLSFKIDRALTVSHVERHELDEDKVFLKKFESEGKLILLGEKVLEIKDLETGLSKLLLLRKDSQRKYKFCKGRMIQEILFLIYKTSKKNDPLEAEFAFISYSEKTKQFSEPFYYDFYSKDLEFILEKKQILCLVKRCGQIYSLFLIDFIEKGKAKKILLNEFRKELKILKFDFLNLHKFYFNKELFFFTCEQNESSSLSAFSLETGKALYRISFETHRHSLEAFSENFFARSTKKEIGLFALATGKKIQTFLLKDEIFDMTLVESSKFMTLAAFSDHGEVEYFSRPLKSQIPSLEIKRKIESKIHSFSLPYFNIEKQNRAVFSSFEKERLFLVVDETRGEEDTYIYAGSLEQREVKELFFKREAKRGLKKCHPLISKTTSFGKGFFGVFNSKEGKLLTFKIDPTLKVSRLEFHSLANTQTVLSLFESKGKLISVGEQFLQINDLETGFLKTIQLKKDPLRSYKFCSGRMIDDKIILIYQTFTSNESFKYTLLIYSQKNNEFSEPLHFNAPTTSASFIYDEETEKVLYISTLSHQIHSLTLIDFSEKEFKIEEISPHEFRKGHEELSLYADFNPKIISFYLKKEVFFCYYNLLNNSYLKAFSLKTGDLVYSLSLDDERDSLGVFSKNFFARYHEKEVTLFELDTGKEFHKFFPKEEVFDMVFSHTSDSVTLTTFLHQGEVESHTYHLDKK